MSTLQAAARRVGWRWLALLLAAGAGGAWAMQAEDLAGWRFEAHGEGWRAASEARPGQAGPRAALILSFAGHTVSREGDYGELSFQVKRPDAGPARLAFTWGDDFTGPTRGFHFAQALVDGVLVWEEDVAGGDLAARTVAVDLPAAAAARDAITVTLRVFDRKVVTNFPLRVWWSDVRLETEGQPPVVLSPRVERPPSGPLPPDLPLPTAPMSEAEWLRGAIVLQPWGKTQHAALADVGDRPRRLREEFGFNAFIVLPTEAHNAITGKEHHLTDAQFRAAVDAYRAAGYRLILYSSVMHCGHAPEWQRGDLGRAHPEWAQRDPEGNVVTVYGQPWLCPNTPALQYTLDYTERIARAYAADGIMLDNNQFFLAKAGWTCHCAACQTRFREYAVRRFGAEGVKRTFGVAAEALKIPREEGPLHSLWLHWRNRVWAEANEAFRERLRRVNPRMLLFANTQYQFGDGLLATDLQYEHEDVLLSESRSLSSWDMSRKMLLGQALAGGRPVWNYIGTFEEKDFSRLRPAETIGPIIAATLAHGARPWIVYYGFHDAQGEYQARKGMSQLLAWYAAHQGLFAGTPRAPVGVVLSLRSRDLLHRAQVPEHVVPLLRAGVPLRLLRDEHLSAETLHPFRVLTLETAACLDEAAVRVLADWVRAGGTLVADPDAGWYDLLGRLRGSSALWDGLGLREAPARPAAVGEGRAVAARSSALVREVISRTEGMRFVLEPEAEIEVIPYQAPGRLLLHLVRHAPGAGPVTLHLPADVHPTGGTARLHAPGLAEPATLPVTVEGGRASIVLRDVPAYAVVEVGVRAR